MFKNKGSRNSITNYRPVTLLNTLSKIYERIIYDSLSNHVEQNNLIYEYQSGFIKGHDTCKQLIHITHMILSNRDSNLATRGIFLDIEGAFDAIPYHLLIHKLRAYGFGPEVMSIISSYLSDRKLKVKVNDSFSDWSPPGSINSGVPQGSILGPLFFLLYINDLVESVENCRIYLYADDCALFLSMDESSAYNSHLLIQNDLDRMSHWSRTWKLYFKASKSKEILFKSPLKHYAPLPHLLVNNEVIPQTDSHKHLGVILDASR